MCRRLLALAVTLLLLIRHPAMGQGTMLPPPVTQEDNQEIFDQMQQELAAKEARLRDIEDQLYEWRDPTASEVESMRKDWEAANPFKTSFDMPKFEQQKIRVRRTDPAEADRQAAAQDLQNRIARLEANLATMKTTSVIVTPTPRQSLAEREAAHEYAVQAELDRRRRNEEGSRLLSNPVPSTNGKAGDSTSGTPDQDKVEAERETAYDRTFDASEEKAIRLYDFVSDPNSTGRKRMLKIEADLLANDDPLYYDPNKPLIIAQMVAKEMRIAPKHAATSGNGTNDSQTPTGNKMVASGQSAGASTVLVSKSASNQLPAESASQSSDGLTILSASYGAENTFRDVTSYVQNAARNGNGRFRADSSTLGGDPAFGKVKTLRIRYEFGGQIYEKTFAENSEARLP